MRDLTPLLMDAARRISKRDENELRDARKRYEGKPEKWTAWLEQFYKRDYPAFVLATLQPFIDARLLDRDTTLAKIQSHCSERGAVVLAENYTPFEPSALLELMKEATHA